MCGFEFTCARGTPLSEGGLPAGWGRARTRAHARNARVTRASSNGRNFIGYEVKTWVDILGRAR